MEFGRKRYVDSELILSSSQGFLFTRPSRRRKWYSNLDHKPLETLDVYLSCLIPKDLFTKSAIQMLVRCSLTHRWPILRAVHSGTTAPATTAQYAVGRGKHVRQLPTGRPFSSSFTSPSPTSPSPTAFASFKPLTDELDKLAPRFELDADQIEILKEPREFYEALKVCRSSVCVSIMACICLRYSVKEERAVCWAETRSTPAPAYKRGTPNLLPDTCIARNIS